MSDFETPSENADLTPVQWQAVALLAEGQTVAQTCERLDISRSTLGRWRALDAFRRELDAAIDTVIGDCLGELAAASCEAVGVLRRLACDESQPGYTRAGAARSILELMLRIREATAFERRLSAIEDRLNETNLTEKP